MVWRHLRNSYSYVFGDCARDLPDQVKSLTLQFAPDQNPTEMQTFRNLRNLSLKLVTSLAIVEIFDLSGRFSSAPIFDFRGVKGKLIESVLRHLRSGSGENGSLGLEIAYQLLGHCRASGFSTFSIIGDALGGLFVLQTPLGVRPLVGKIVRIVVHGGRGSGRSCFQTCESSWIGDSLHISFALKLIAEELRKSEIFEVDDTKEDCLSKLPDDVLCSILGNLTVRDAARTSILSTRWKYVFASTQLRQQQPTFEFRCSDMLRIHPEVAHVQMVCCFGREFPSAFTHWFQSLSRISVESLHLSFECILGDLSQLLTFSLEVLSQSSSLEHLVLQGCVVLSSPKVRFNSLMTLTLGVVVLNSGHLEGILSSCSNLKKLTIVGCNLPYKLRLSGTVMDVVIWECVGGKEIDLHAAHLRILEYKINNNVRFFFSFVPVLENVMVWRDLRHSYSYEFGDRARDLPDQVKSLTLQFIPDQIYPSFENPTEMQMFRNLRSLILKLVSSLAIVELCDLYSWVHEHILTKCLIRLNADVRNSDGVMRKLRRGGKVVLPLLAFGGIALWINYYYRGRTIRSSQEEVCAKSDLYEFGTKSVLYEDPLTDSDSSSLEHLVLQGCVVLSSPKVRFNSLITLTLNAVVLTSGHLEGILSSCSNLQRLTIVCCKLPYKLRLTGTLMVVVIWDCIGVKEIDLHAAHLRMLEYKIYNKVRFFFSFVPVLENVMVWGNLRYSSYSYVFGDCARDLPDQVKSLTLQFTPDQIYPSFENPTEMQMFRNLRNLSLKLVTRLAIVEILFALYQVIELPTTRERRRPPPSPTRHTELKQVTYGGFNGLDTQMEFVLYILRCAAVLEQMFLSPGYKSEFFIDRNSVSNLSFDEEKRNLIQQRLHGQAIPGKATLIIQ
ncbi:hypothetical protein BC332_29292 [Capsicum chinense]|nr:hypothetical protein BC332_29292 [Capsicum chinense]